IPISSVAIPILTSILPFHFLFVEEDCSRYSFSLW
ncbi:unnamed protein product, partial [marine sediment metagenome]